VGAPRPAWLPALAALFFAGLTCWLGQWQLGRAEEKRAGQAAFDAAAGLPAMDIAALPTSPAPYSRIRVTGRFDAAYQIYLDNRMHQGRPGYQVIVPLAYSGGVVLVNRGWLPAGGDRGVRPDAPLPSEPVTLEGLLVPAQSRYVELSEQGVAGPVWQNLSLVRYRTGIAAICRTGCCCRPRRETAWCATGHGRTRGGEASRLCRAMVFADCGDHCPVRLLRAVEAFPCTALSGSPSGSSCSC